VIQCLYASFHHIVVLVHSSLLLHRLSTQYGICLLRFCPFQTFKSLPPTFPVSTCVHIARERNLLYNLQKRMKTVLTYIEKPIMIEKDTHHYYLFIHLGTNSLAMAQNSDTPVYMSQLDSPLQQLETQDSVN